MKEQPNRIKTIIINCCDNCIPEPETIFTGCLGGDHFCSNGGEKLDNDEYFENIIPDWCPLEKEKSE